MFEDEWLQVLKSLNWKEFLRVDENKTELFKFLSQQAIHLPIDEGKVIYATDGSNVHTTMANAVLTNLSPCLHKEADTPFNPFIPDPALKQVMTGRFLRIFKNSYFIARTFRLHTQVPNALEKHLK